MDVNANDEAAWHAATDRYAAALRKMANGERDAREALSAAYRNLKALGRPLQDLALRNASPSTSWPTSRETFRGGSAPN